MGKIDQLIETDYLAVEDMGFVSIHTRQITLLHLYQDSFALDKFVLRKFLIHNLCCFLPFIFLLFL